jgi:hypothetical protein
MMTRVIASKMSEQLPVVIDNGTGPIKVKETPKSDGTTITTATNPADGSSSSGTTRQH